MKNISFTQIADEIADFFCDKEKDRDSTIKRLNRQFAKIIELAGGNIENLKNGRSRMFFDEDEAKAVHFILRQLACKEGVVYSVLKNKKKGLSLDETHQLIQEILNEMQEDGELPENPQPVVNILDLLFNYSIRAKLNDCHRLLDAFALNLCCKPYTYQLAHINQLEQQLSKLSVVTATENAVETVNLAKLLEQAMALGDTRDPSDLYGDKEDAIKLEYRRRDERVLSYLTEIPEIRSYVEKIVGKSIGEIWPDWKGEEDGPEKTDKKSS